MTSSRHQSVVASPPIVAVGSPSKINVAPQPSESHRTVLFTLPRLPPQPYILLPHTWRQEDGGRRTSASLTLMGAGRAARRVLARPRRGLSAPFVEVLSTVPESPPAPTPTQAPSPPSTIATIPCAQSQVTAVMKPKSRHSRHMA